MEWIITDVAVPLVIAAVTAFGATAYATKRADRREQRHDDQIATAAIRKYIRELRNRSIYLEEVELSRGGGWDPDWSVIDPGSDEAVRAAYREAAPFFYRLDVSGDNRPATSNSMPDMGSHAMEGAENFWKRAEMVEMVLSLGLLPAGPRRIRSAAAAK